MSKATNPLARSAQTLKEKKPGSAQLKHQIGLKLHRTDLKARLLTKTQSSLVNHHHRKSGSMMMNPHVIQNREQREVKITMLLRKPFALFDDRI